MWQDTEILIHSSSPGLSATRSSDDMHRLTDKIGASVCLVERKVAASDLENRRCTIVNTLGIVESRVGSAWLGSLVRRILLRLEHRNYVLALS